MNCSRFDECKGKGITVACSFFSTGDVEIVVIVLSVLKAKVCGVPPGW